MPKWEREVGCHSWSSEGQTVGYTAYFGTKDAYCSEIKVTMVQLSEYVVGVLASAETKYGWFSRHFKIRTSPTFSRGGIGVQKRKCLSQAQKRVVQDLIAHLYVGDNADCAVFNQLLKCKGKDWNGYIPVGGCHG